MPINLTNLKNRLSVPVSITFLIVFRIFFGFIMLWEVWRYADSGRIDRYYRYPEFYFTFDLFHWLQPLPGTGMYWHFTLLAVLSFFILIGFAYRLSMAAFFIAFSYIFLLDKTNYLNHFYLIILLSFLLIFMPAHKTLSIDSWRNPNLRSTHIQAWSLWLLRFQIAIVYVYGGIAKLNLDWLQGKPMNEWLLRSQDFPVIGTLFDEPWAGLAFSWGGLLLDLFIVPFLLWKRTRVPAFLLITLFHLINVRLFSIGIFPWFMIAATLVFFPPDWPLKVVSFLSDLVKQLNQTGREFQTTQLSTFGFTLILLFAAVQLIMPLRHYANPSHVSWSEEGHRFAWHMKLRDKDANASFTVIADNEVISIDLRNFLTSRQRDKMPRRPDMIVQFAHHLEDMFQLWGYEEIKVNAEVWVSLNGRPPQLMIDPNVDLTEESFNWRNDWIMPLEIQSDQTVQTPSMLD